MVESGPQSQCMKHGGTCIGVGPSHGELEGVEIDHRRCRSGYTCAPV